MAPGAYNHGLGGGAGPSKTNPCAGGDPRGRGLYRCDGSIFGADWRGRVGRRSWWT